MEVLHNHEEIVFARTSTPTEANYSRGLSKTGAIVAALAMVSMTRRLSRRQTLGCDGYRRK